MPTIGGDRETRLEGGRDAKQLADGNSSWLALDFSADGCLFQARSKLKIM